MDKSYEKWVSIATLKKLTDLIKWEMSFYLDFEFDREKVLKCMITSNSTKL